MASSSLAHMVRLFAVADEMRKRGHEILFTATHDRKEFILKFGYPVYHKTYTPINFNDPQDQSINYLKSHHNDFVEYFRTEIEAAEEFRPDVVITSPGFLGPHVTYKTGIPTVAILNAPYLDESIGVLGLSLTKDTLPHKAMRKALKPLFDKQFTQNYANEIFSVYKDLGIDFKGSTRKELYKGMHTIIPSVYDFEPVEKSSYVMYSGPLFWDGFDKSHPINTEEINAFKGTRKLVYFSFGGSIFNYEFYERMFSIIANLPYAFVVSTGPNFPLHDIVYNAQNTRVYDFVPGQKVCELADLVLNTGAHGSIMQALSCGKPIISIPCNIDQSYFAYRIEELGIGFNINKVHLWDFTRRERYYKLNDNLGQLLESKIKTIFTDKSYYQKAGHFAQLIKDAGNAAVNISNHLEYKYGN
jgi:UDP:flavonoid glycosyltransferase YjiC (YdhE family)